MSDLEHIRQVVRAFAAEREWQRFHSPRNLAMSPTCTGTWWRWRINWAWTSRPRSRPRWHGTRRDIPRIAFAAGGRKYDDPPDAA